MEWKHQKRLTWVALVLFTGFIAACGSSDSDTVAPTQAFSQVTGDVTYTGLKTQAALTAENADTMAAGALGFDIFGTTPEAKALSDTADLLTGHNSEALSLAELFDSLPKTSAATTKSPGPGYGGFYSLYDTVDLELEEPEEVLRTVLATDFPNISDDASFSQSTTMLLSESENQATFTTTLSFTDCMHCDDWDFIGNDPALCEELTTLDADSAQITTIVDLTGITESDLTELKAMEITHPDIALTRLVNGSYQGHSAEEPISYSLPYTCSLTYTGTVERTEKYERENTVSSNTLEGTFVSSFENIMDFPLDTDAPFNKDPGYGGYVAQVEVWDGGGDGYGGYATSRKASFTGSMTLEMEGGIGIRPKAKDVSPSLDSMTVNLTIPEGTITKEYSTKYFSNSHTFETLEEVETTERNGGKTDISITGATNLALSWDQQGVAGNLLVAVTEGAIKETQGNFYFLATETETTKHSERTGETVSYEFTGNARLDASLTADLLSPVAQSLTMECQNGSILYSSQNDITTYDSTDASDGTPPLDTGTAAANLIDLSLSGQVTFTSADNYFRYNGGITFSDKDNVWKHDNLITHPDYAGDVYDEKIITATDVTLQTNGIDISLEGNYASREGSWWDTATESITGGEGVTTTDLDLVIVNNLASTSRWFNNYHLVTTPVPFTTGDYPGIYTHDSTTLTGRFYNSEFGYVDVATNDGAPLLTFPLSNYPGYLFPTYGEIVVTGASGTSASLVPLVTEVNTPEGDQRIPVPDGYRVIFGETVTEYLWPDMEAMLSQNWFYRLASFGIDYFEGGISGPE